MYVEVRRADGSLGVKMKDIKITANCYREFHSMIDTCADNSEDDYWYGLWTQLSNASNIRNSYNSPLLVLLNDDQLKMLIHWIQNHIEYLEVVTIGQCNDDRDYKSANGVRYTIKGLTKLMNELSPEKAVA